MSPVGAPVDRDEFLERLGALNQWSARGERAPHKPLLLLLALARLQQGDDRWIRFDGIEDPLRRLLEEFGPPRKSHHPEYPFWHLRSDGLWVVENDEALSTIGSGSNPPITVLREEGVGGFPEDVYQLLHQNPRFVAEAAQVVLDEHFPPSIHEDLLGAVGLDARMAATKARRDPDFRRAVLRAYEYRCAMCGWDGQLETVAIGIDAAHVRWWAYGGPDELTNGLALCALHHRAFDRGVVGVGLDRCMTVSRLFRGSSTAKTLVLDLAGRPIADPQEGLPFPADEFLEWHQREVFKGDPRESSAGMAAESTGDWDGRTQDGG